MTIKLLFGGALNGSLANILLPLLGVVIVLIGVFAIGNLFVSQQTGQIIFENISERNYKRLAKSKIRMLYKNCADSKPSKTAA